MSLFLLLFSPSYSLSASMPPSLTPESNAIWIRIQFSLFQLRLLSMMSWALFGVNRGRTLIEKTVTGANVCLIRQVHTSVPKYRYGTCWGIWLTELIDGESSDSEYPAYDYTYLAIQYQLVAINQLQALKGIMRKKCKETIRVESA